MIEMLRIYSKGFLENVTIEELPHCDRASETQYSANTELPLPDLKFRIMFGVEKRGW